MEYSTKKKDTACENPKDGLEESQSNDSNNNIAFCKLLVVHLILVNCLPILLHEKLLSLLLGLSLQKCVQFFIASTNNYINFFDA